MLPLLAAVAGLAGPAAAHPHVFVDSTAGFVFDAQDRLSALTITWVYDPFTSLMLFDALALDEDRDGKLDDADRAAIVAGETDWPPEYNGDIHLDRAGAPIAMGRPRDGIAWMEGDRIAVRFDLPLAQPTGDTDGVRLRLYDPTYYFDYTVIGLGEVDAPPGCEVRIDPFEFSEATSMLQVQLSELGREEIPEQEDVGALFADEVHLTCT